MLILFVHDGDEKSGESGEPLGMVAKSEHGWYYENWVTDDSGQGGYVTKEEALSELLTELGLS